MASSTGRCETERTIAKAVREGISAYQEERDERVPYNDTGADSIRNAVTEALDDRTCEVGAYVPELGSLDDRYSADRLIPLTVYGVTKEGTAFTIGLDIVV